MKSFKRNAVVGAAAVLLSGAAYADFEGESKDAWLTGKVETVFLLNGHLNNFTIDTDVENGIVHLTGTVKSEIDRDLAVQLARGVEGVVEVREELVVDADMEIAERDSEAGADDDDQRSFGTFVDDATTTAAVKSKLLSNSNVKGLQIDVDTRGDVVTLSGSVESEEQKSLAEELARNTGDVSDVRNNLVVDAAL